MKDDYDEIIPERRGISLKMTITLILLAITVIVGLLLSRMIVATVEKGTYQIKQAAVTGKMSAKMTPGLWLRLFGDIQVWPKAATFYFTAEEEEGEGREGSNQDRSIEVRFNDGSVCAVSGTMRIVFPTDKQHAIDLVTVHGYEDYEDLELKLILPVVRNALRLTANLLTARESYSEKRADFIFWAWDQIQNGIYETREEERLVKDLVTGEEVYRTFKIIKKDPDGRPHYMKNPLEGHGITLANFEIKSFVYAEKVMQQIEKQNQALMEVSTARARAKEAEQRARTVEAEGKANVMKSKYEAEQTKVVSEVEAERDKRVAELEAEKELAVAKLRKQAAEFDKEKNILIGEGEAKKKRLIMEADGALQQKLETYERVMAKFAEEFAKQKWVPEMMMGNCGGEASGNSAMAFIDLMTMKAMNDLGLELKIPKGNINTTTPTGVSQ